jgi:hypothetical protein
MNNTWKLLGDQRLPPVISDHWSYEADSWSWRPKEYNQYKPIDTPMTLSHDYYNYIQAEKTVPHPLITMRGGLSNVDISALEDATLQFPDIKSETARSRTILTNFAQQLAARGMLLPKVVY